MESIYTLSNTKSLKRKNFVFSFFIQKIKNIGIGFFIAFAIFCCFGFGENGNEKINFTSSFIPNEEDFISAYSVGPNDTVDLALVLSTPNSVACPGSTVSFTIEIINQGNTIVESFEITDYVPAGLTLSATGNTGWVQTGDKVKKTISAPLSPNGFATEQIVFEFDSTFTGAFVENRAEISFADCDNDPTNAAPFELDSFFDDIDNDSIGGDNIIDGSFGDEDDHDFAIVMNDAPQVADITVTSSLCNFDNGTATITPNTFDSYDWSDGGTGAVRTDLFAGIYTVTITKTNGCSTVDTLEVFNDCTGCEAIAGTVTMEADTFCMNTGDTLCVNFTDDGNSFEPQPQFITSYFLTKGDDKVILAVDTAKQFKITEKGNYRIHVKVFDVLHIPQEEVDGVIVGVTPISFLDSFLMQGQGYLCGALDTTGIEFEVGTASTTIDSTAASDCYVADGYALLSPAEYSYAWSDGGSGNERNDLAPGTYDVTVTGCADCMDTVQNIVIGSNCILNDTIYFTLETDSTEAFCSNGTPIYFSNNTTTTLCDGGTSGMDFTYGSYTVSETGCLIYTSNFIPGTNIDTICVVVNDDQGNADTTVFIPSIICHTVPQIINAPCNMTISTGQLCLPIPFDSIADYNVTLDGNPIQNGFVGCDEGSLHIYDYSQVFAQGNFGDYDLDSWGFGGNTFTLTFATIQDLVDEMNNWDPTGNWILNTVDLTISGGDPTVVYDDLEITHVLTNSSTTVTSTLTTLFNGSAMTLNEGTFQVVYTKSGDNCPSAALQVTVSCTPCTPFLPADTVQIVANNCNDFGNFCVGVPTANIFDYQIMIDGGAYGGTFMACNFSGNNDGTNLQLSMGLHEVIFTEITTSCADTVMVNVTCPPCLAWLPDGVDTLLATACSQDAMACLNVPAAQLSDYQITDNGVVYTGSIGTCMNGTDATIGVDTGFHEIVMLNLPSGCTDTMSVFVICASDTIYLDTLIEVTDVETFCFDESIEGDISSINVFCGDTTINNTIDYTFDTLTNCIVFEGLMIGTDTLCFEIFNAMGDRTVVFISIEVIPPCGAGFLPDSLDLILNDCGSTTQLCVDIPINEIFNYAITDNGILYNGNFQGCNFDTALSYTVFTVPAQGTVGPYNVDSWTVNGNMFSGGFNTVPELVDSMNVWDVTGTWTFDPVTLIIAGGNSTTTYGSMTITQVNTSAFAVLELNLDLIGLGTSIDVGEGAHEIIFTENTTMCVDTIQAMVLCVSPDVVMDTVDIAGIGTYCIDTTELMGNIISMTNTCPTQSGTNASFTLDINTFCVDYEGLVPGQDSACIVICDDLGACDTTTIIVNVMILPDIVIDTVDVGEIGTYCVDTTELSGTIVSMTNFCPTQSGNNALFTLDNNTYCVDYEGLSPGQNSACIVICDDLGACDTTTVIVNVNMLLQPEIIIDTVNIGEVGTYCVDTTELPGNVVSMTNTCPSQSGFMASFTLDNGTYCVDYEGLNPGQNTACIIVCDDLGFCDTTTIIVNVLLQPGLVIDTISIGAMETYCVDTTELLGNVVSMTNFCPTQSGDAVMFELVDSSYCVNYEGLLPGQNTACIEICDDLGACDTTTIIVNVLLQPEIIIDTINIGEIATYCIDTTELPGNVVSMSNTCPTQSGDMVLFELVDSSYCVNSLGLIPGQDTACIIVCDDLGFCDTTTIIVNVVLQPGIIVDTVTVGEVGTYCVDTTELLGNIVSIDNICPSQTGNFALFELVDSTYCVNYEGLTPGQNTACIVICDDLGACDTTTMLIYVITNMLDLPVATNDIDTTFINQDIVMNIFGNDTINGTFDTIYMVTPPAFGSVVVNADGTATYSPNLDYCDNENPDIYTYVMCNTNGCDTATVTIWVFCESGGDLTIYNGFSPNGDNVNDVFMIRGVEGYPNNVLCIFNRWGNRVYYKEGYDNTFDGSWEATTLPDGTYFYVFDDGIGNRFSGYVQIAR